MSPKRKADEEEESDESEKDASETADGAAPEGEVSMTIWEHLAELRTRLMRAALAMIGGAVVAWVYREKLLAWIAQPYRNAWATKFPNEPLVVTKLFDEIAPKYADRTSGYTRIVKIGLRRGDAAPIVQLELV